MFVSCSFGPGCLHCTASPRFVSAELSVRRAFWLQPLCCPVYTLLYLGLTQAYLVRELPGEQQTDFMIIFHPCCSPYTGRTARKKNINQRARLQQRIQAILFHVDIWYNVLFQFSVHFLCLFVTWPTTGQSHTPFRCIQKAVQGLGRVLSTLHSSKLCTTHLA